MVTFEKLYAAGKDENGKQLYFSYGACLSSDEKPTDGIANGSTLREMDTSKDFMFDQNGAEWLEQT